MPPPATIPDKQNGGEARDLATSPDPPPSAGTAPPPRRRRRWALLRVLLATLALGWWPLHAMRRHFDAGPYTGPLYIYFVDGSEERPGLMDDTGRIVVPAGEWEGFRKVSGPDGVCWLAYKEAKTLVVSVDGSLPVREKVRNHVLLDGSGRRLWHMGAAPVTLKSRYQEPGDVRVGVMEGGDLLYALSETNEAKSWLMTFDGKVVLEADWIELMNDSPMVFVRDRLPGAKSLNGAPTRALLWREGRWIELARHLGMRWQGDVEVTLEDDERATVLGAVAARLEGERPQYGVVRGDLRWRLLDWGWQAGDYPILPIANAPGSRPGDPPIFSLADRVDGAWLAVLQTDLRAVLAGGLWGLQAADGQWIVEPRWIEVYHYDRSVLLGIDAQGRQSIVDLEGRVRLPPTTAKLLWSPVPDDPSEPAGFLAYVPRPAPAQAATPGDVAGSDIAGAVPPTPDTHWPDFDEGLYGWLNGQGAWITPPIYSDFSPLWLDEDRRIFVVTSAETGLFGLVQENGTPILPPRYKHLMYLGGNSWYVDPALEGAPSNGEPESSTEETFTNYRSAWITWHEDRRIIRIGDDRQAPLDLQCELFKPVNGVGYLVVRQSKIGLVDLQGQEILPAVHTRLIRPTDTQVLFACEWPDEVDEPLTAKDAGSYKHSNPAYLKSTRNDDDTDSRYQYRLFDLRTRRWLPQTLATWYGGSAIRRASDGWGLLQPDFQTLLNYRDLGLPGPLENLITFRRSWVDWNFVGVPLDMPIYMGIINGQCGLLLRDGRLLMPFICRSISIVDARFMKLQIGNRSVWMDRAGGRDDVGGAGCARLRAAPARRASDGGGTGAGGGGVAGARNGGRPREGLSRRMGEPGGGRGGGVVSVLGAVGGTGTGATGCEGGEGPALSAWASDLQCRSCR